jgi:hypothetical protein
MIPEATIAPEEIAGGESAERKGGGVETGASGLN